MNRFFGSLRQMGFVVRDIDKATRHWVEVCGIGPCYIAEKLPPHGFWYKEQRYDGIPLTIALANFGDVQLDLIQPRDETPSMYGDFLATGHEGLQHWSSWPENYHGRSRTGGRSASAARVRAARSCISSSRGTPAPSSKWRS